MVWQITWQDTAWTIFILGIILFVLGIIKPGWLYHEPVPNSVRENYYERHIQLDRKGLVAGIIIVFIFGVSDILTRILFQMFPANQEAPNVVTVFAGVFGVIIGNIGLYKLLTERKPKG